MSDHQQHILVAEDAPINMQVIKNQLETLGQIDKCVFAFNGQEALDMASKIVKKSIEDYKELDVIQPIELCILDFQMPRLNGIEFVKLFRNFIRNTNG